MRERLFLPWIMVVLIEKLYSNVRVEKMNVYVSIINGELKEGVGRTENL